MRTLAFINLKGGTGKTVSAANVAHILAAVHRKKVLLVDGTTLLRRGRKIISRK